MTAEIRTSELPSFDASEMQVLFLCVFHAECRDRALASLKPTDFFYPDNRFFFQTICDLVEDRAPVSEALIQERIYATSPEQQQAQRLARFNEFGSTENWWALPLQLKWHMDRMIDAAVLRATHALAAKIGEQATETLADFSSRQLLDSAEERLRDLRRDTGNTTEADIKDLFANYGDDYEAAAAGTLDVRRSIPIGIPSIDAANRGPFGSELVVIAGRPSSGKSAMGLQIALLTSPAYVVSLEMDEEQIRDRAIAHLTEIPLNAIKDKQFTGDQLAKYVQGLGEFKGKCRVNFKRGMFLSEICHASRQSHRVLGIKLVIIDQLSHIQVTGRFEKDYEKIGFITRELKALALELKIPVILLTQLNRESEKEKREPMLSDLARSGSIEQDADQVWAIHAPKGIGEPARTLIVLKGRNTGAGHRVEINFLTDTQRLEESIQ